MYRFDSKNIIINIIDVITLSFSITLLILFQIFHVYLILKLKKLMTYHSNIWQLFITPFVAEMCGN